mmetsp:Transcript_17574/g.36132  ORF Transcript_17574/g.36132 Transcript_17574/m.36132 type:complete len:370 (-) Transcript_17574:53-1162(-)
MNVVLSVRGEVKVDNQRYLLDINTTGKQIGGDQDTGRTGTEFSHNDITLALVHVSVHARDGEVTLLHFFLQPIDLAPGVTVDDGLGNGQGLVQIAQGFEFPFFSVHGNVELLNTFQGQLVFLHKNTNGFAHKAVRNLQDVQRHRSGEQADLDLFGEELEDVVDLLLETARKHLIGLIQEELLHAFQSQGSSGDHVVDTTGGSNNNVDTCLESTNVVTDSGTSDTSVDLNVHVISKSQNNFLNLARQLTGWGQDQGLTLLDRMVDNSQTTDREGGGFTGTGLGLGDQISSRNSGSDGTLLDSGGLFETVRVNTTKERFGQFHTVEGLDDLIPVGRNVGIGQAARRSIVSAFGGCIIWWGVTWFVGHSSGC